MGYSSYLRGEISFNPPIAGRAIDDVPRTSELLGLEVEEVTEQVPEGTLIRKEADRIIRIYEDSAKAYRLKEELQAIVSALPGREFDGYIYREGEESGDLERLSVVDGKVVSEKATLTWPDGGTHQR